MNLKTSSSVTSTTAACRKYLQQVWSTHFARVSVFHKVFWFAAHDSGLAKHVIKSPGTSLEWSVCLHFKAPVFYDSNVAVLNKTSSPFETRNSLTLEVEKKTSEAPLVGQKKETVSIKIVTKMKTKWHSCYCLFWQDLEIQVEFWAVVFIWTPRDVRCIFVYPISCIYDSEICSSNVWQFRSIKASITRAAIWMEDGLHELWNFLACQNLPELWIVNQVWQSWRRTNQQPNILRENRLAKVFSTQCVFSFIKSKDEWHKW